jgi:hypothetical protein
MTGRLTLLAIVITSALPSIAYAHAGNGDPNVIHACVGNLTKVVRIVGINGACLIAPAAIAETPVHWHTAGPPGEPGKQGPEGPVGPIGPMGPSGIAAAISFTCGATELPANFQELQMLPNCSTVIDVADGQTLLVQIEMALSRPAPTHRPCFLRTSRSVTARPARRVYRRRPCPSGPRLASLAFTTGSTAFRGC